MEPIKALTTIDYSSLFIAIFTSLIGLKAVVSILEWLIEKLGIETKWMRQKRKEHNLLIQTSDSLKALQKKYLNLVEQTIIHNNEIKNDLFTFMSNINSSVEILKNKQNELINTVNEIVESNKTRDDATIEEMCDRICQKTRYYINVLNGIPEDEYDDFVRLFKSYEAIGGNHGAKEKYEYCMKHLDILPVKKEVIIEK